MAPRTDPRNDLLVCATSILLVVALAGCASDSDRGDESTPHCPQPTMARHWSSSTSARDTDVVVPEKCAGWQADEGEEKEDIVYEIETTETVDGKLKYTGKLTWDDMHLASKGSISGPLGNGATEKGRYRAFRKRLVFPIRDPEMTDSKGLAWFQCIQPMFKSTRTGIGIHPDGRYPGTHGCIGLEDSDTRGWLRAFQEIDDDAYVVVVVK